MSLSVMLQNISGPVVESYEDEVLEKLLPLNDDKSSPMLRYVDRYGVTIFNKYQVHTIMSEIDSMEICRLGSDESQSIERFRKILSKCINSAHLLVKIEGD